MTEHRPNSTLPRLMRAARHSRYGSAHEALEIVTDHAVPTPGPGQLLVRNHATSVNPIDSVVRGGYGAEFWKSTGQVVFPHIPGRDVVGTVVEVGPGASRFAVGDRVWAGTFSGGSAEYVVIQESWAARPPHEWTDVEAGSLPYVALTVWSALVDQAGLTPESARGKKIIIPRGAGGVGSFAIQLMKAWGAEVATIVSTGNVDLVRRLGADTVIDRTQQDFSEVLHDYDVAFNTSFGIEQALLDALKTGADAAYVSIVTPKMQLMDKHGLEKGQAMGKELFQQMVDSQRALGRRYYWSFMQPNGDALAQVAKLAETGAIQPVIDRVFPLEKLAEAHELSDTKQVQGKIVIQI